MIQYKIPVFVLLVYNKLWVLNEDKITRADIRQVLG